jgi:hypothetical protein
MFLTASEISDIKNIIRKVGAKSHNNSNIEYVTVKLIEELHNKILKLEKELKSLKQDTQSLKQDNSKRN